MTWVGLKGTHECECHNLFGTSGAESVVVVDGKRGVVFLLCRHLEEQLCRAVLDAISQCGLVTVDCVLEDGSARARILAERVFSEGSSSKDDAGLEGLLWAIAAEERSSEDATLIARSIV